MDLTLGRIADVPVDGRVTNPEGQRVEDVPAVAEPAEHVEAEFWDACWTLEDEWQPRVVVRSGHRSRRKHSNHLPEVFVLL